MKKLEISNLGNLIDGLAKNASAVVAETSTHVSVSNVQSEAAIYITQACNKVGWPCSLFDGADQPCEITGIHEDFAPFRAVIVKPPQSPGVLPVLTITGLNNFLQSQPSHSEWLVAGLSERIITRSIVLRPWDDECDFYPMPITKNPRSLVREYTNNRTVPPDIRPFLLAVPDVHVTTCAASFTWLNASVRAICRSLVNEIDAETGALKCNGTPKLSILFPEPTEDLSLSFSLENFKYLQMAATWVFDNEREAESRHTLMVNEIARVGNANANLAECFAIHISSALSSAKIAYQMMLSDVSKDTLKALGDLKKAVTEETAKVTEVTRQLVGGVSAAIAVGIGLIATRVSTSAHPGLIATVMVLVAVYVSVIIYSGAQFVSIQRQLRTDWQSKLYRFLPSVDYEKMVSVPTGRSEHTFFVSAWISGSAVIVLTIIVLFLSATERVPEGNNSGSAVPKASVVTLPSSSSARTQIVRSTHSTSSTVSSTKPTIISKP